MPSFATPPTLPSATRRKTLAGLAAAQATANRAPSVILPRLYLTNWTVAENEALLTELGVTHVVSVLEFPPEYAGAIKTLHVRVEDSFRTDILSHLDETTEFIRAALDENAANKVLVHCLMGVSRSTTVVCAYLIATTPMNASEAIDFVAERRAIASPNIGFRRQLETYAQRFATQKVRSQGIVGALVGKVKSLHARKDAEVREPMPAPEEPVPVAA